MKIVQSAVLVGLVWALCLSPGALAVAAPNADNPYEVVIAFDSGVHETIAYGESWDFDVYADSTFYYSIFLSHRYTVSIVGAPSSYTAQMYILDPNTHPGRGEPSGALYMDYSAPPLTAGTYTINIVGSGVTNSDGTAHGKTPTPALLTVTPAPLTIDLRATADPSRPDATIVAASLSGQYIDRYANGYADDPYELPAGEWNITVTDDNDHVVGDYSTQATGGDDAFATGFYFTDATADTIYTAKATFTPSGALAPSFSVSPSSEVSFTPRLDTRPVPTSTAEAAIVPPQVEQTGLHVPIWVLIALGLLLAGLAAFGSELFLRLRKLARVSAEVGE